MVIKIPVVKSETTSFNGMRNTKQASIAQSLFVGFEKR